MLGQNPLPDNGPYQCWYCNRFLSKGPIRGAFQCKFCDEIYLTKRVSYLEVKRYNDSLADPKNQLLSFIQARKITTFKAIRNHFPEACVIRIVNQLHREGKVTFQQSGYLGDNLHHERLIVSAQGMGSSVICAQVRRPVL
jgi:hypothetical protein